MHFLKSEFDQNIRYFEELLGIPWQQMSATAGQLDNLQNIVQNMDEDQFRNMPSKGGEEIFDYVITKFPLDLEFPIVFEAGSIFVYRITPAD